MAYDILMKEAKDLPDDMLEQAIDFIRFLKYASLINQTSHSINDDTAFQRSVNPLASDFISIADDFDETPECFKEYV
ncbi:MAG: DUF2281 domain-containing protein [Bacteroidales bacterium]|nr:DUF2281 domain-containing protein [Bacteroidales bacterium]MCM1415783.1 DUF2281 domain-containing protein [bacterium]MCM1422723.1 DUF2281 domain-containing protein [bacterium]